jgi:hypothetical protein
MSFPRPLSVAVVIALLLAGAGCGASTPTAQTDPMLTSLTDAVDVSRMMETIDYMTSEELRGRAAGSPQSSELELFLEESMAELGLAPVEQLGLDSLRQVFPVPAESCLLEDTPPAGEAVDCANILGMIEGQAADDMIFLTANYDGLGVDPNTGSIYPGADYNASGAAAVLELAAVFSSLEEKPGKTIVFALLGAEECGGYGAAALAESLETGGLRDSARIINLEGLGAGSGDYMDVWDLNYRKNRPTVEAIDEAAALLEVELELGGERLGTPASTFFLFHIPAVTVDWSWFERDDHPDFHLSSDTADKIREEGLQQVTEVVAAATWMLSR